jgi:hypothetical protein
MSERRLRPAVRALTLVVATVALTLSGGAPSWTDSLKPSIGSSAETQPPEPADAPSR